jgi:hypothetical protein
MTVGTPCIKKYFSVAEPIILYERVTLLNAAQAMGRVGGSNQVLLARLVRIET